MVRGRIAAIVATIGEYLLASDFALVAQTLIHEVPDIATLVFGILADDVPILLEATHRVTHGMGILTLYQRTGIVCLGIFLAVLIAHIHRTEDVCLAVVASLLILHRTSRIVSLHPVVGLLEIGAIAGLIAQRPDNDAGVVLERHHIALLALYMSLGIVGTLGQSLVTITHAVALDIRLCRQIDAILVAEVVPTGIVGIVAGAYGIDIQILHDLDVLNHALHGDDIATVGIELMTVGTFY